MTSPNGTRRRSGTGSSTGGAFLTMGASEGVAQGASLYRAMIIASVIGSEQMGIAFTMLLFGEFLNRLTNLNPGKLNLHNPKPRLHNTQVQTNMDMANY